MKAILCNDCGAVMSRFSNECKSCKRTNLSFHADRHSNEFKRRTALLRAANTDYSRHFFVVSLLLGFVIALGMGHHSSPHAAKLRANAEQVKTATSSSTLLQ